ncbi:MAG: nucleotidyltransferase domain-containing protein [Gammaproteobacteria bacterium]
MAAIDILVMGHKFNELNAEIGSFCRQHHVRRLSLFGSAARAEMGPLSDVDLLIEFEQGHAPSLAGLERLRQSLATIFGTEAIDLATTSILRNPYRRRAILADLQELND